MSRKRKLPDPIPQCISPKMAESTYPEKTNWYQCLRLVMEGGRLILKEILKESYRDMTFNDFLKSKQNILETLYKKRGILHETQWNQLFPNADIDKLDITLLSCVIWNCVLEKNSPSLESQKGAIQDIRNLRNMFGHTVTEWMTKDEFEANWKKITTTFSNAQNIFSINTSLNELIDKVKKEQVVNSELLMELEAWKQSDLVWKQEMQNRVSNIEERVEKVEDIQKSTSLLNEQKRTIDDQGWSELQNLLVNRYKLLIKSPVTSPPLAHETEIDNIYEEPKLKLIDHKALRKQSFDRNETSLKLIDHKTRRKHSSDRNEKALNLKDIFLNDGNKCYNIYVTGDAGIGKTSLCKFILSSWCKTHQDQTNNDFNDFELALKQFDFLFYVSLRHAIGQFDIEEMIEAQLCKYFVPTNEVLRGLESKFILQELFELFAEKCLIILDGLDEWTAPKPSNDPSVSNGVPMRNPLLKYTLMTFTRPWKLEEVRLKTSELDRQIKITGVEDMSAFGKKLISYFNKHENTNMTFTDFDKHLKKSDLLEMQETPFIFKHLICLWLNNEEFGKSKTEVYTNMIELWFKIAEKRENERDFKHPKDETITTPEVFKKNGKCDGYKTLLMAVGKLAFETLTHRKGIQLVFDSSEEYGVTEDQMSICLKVGILTKSIVQDMVSEKKDISFSHKTFQEYFAALYMGWHSSNPENIEFRMTDITMSDREEFFTFLSGMWPSLFERLTEIQLDKDDVISYSVQDLVIKCCEESLKQNNVCPTVNLWNIFLSQDYNDNGTYFDLMSRILQQQLRPNGDFSIVDLSNLTKLKGINLFNIHVMELHLSPVTKDLILNVIKLLNHNGIASLMKSVSSMKVLRSLYMETIYCREHDENKCFLNVDLSKLDELRSVKLHRISAMELCLRPVTDHLILNEIKLLNHHGIASLMASVSSMKGLKSIYLRIIYCREHDKNECFLNVDLSKLDELRSVELHDISAKEICLSPATEELDLSDIELLNHNGIKSLMESVSSMKGLRSINVDTFYCREHDENKCFLNVDLSKLDELIFVKLYHISAMELCLSPATEALFLYDIKLLNHNGILSLMENVSSMKGLRSIDIRTIYCREHNKIKCFLNVDLSKLDELRSVRLAHISAMEICLSPATEELELGDIKLLNHNGIKSLMESVSSMKGLRSIYLFIIYCREHDKNECFLNVDLSKLDELRSVKLYRISAMELCLSPATEELFLCDSELLNHYGIVSLMENVSSMKGLRSIDIRTIYCREHDKNECFLNVDLSKLDKLIFVKLYHISAMELCLSPATEALFLFDIKLLNHNGILSLMESVSNMKRLTCIQMNTIYCREHDKNECFLNVDLSKLDELRFVKLDHISAMGICLSHATKVLNLNDIKLFNHKGIESLIKSVFIKQRSVECSNIYCREHDSYECFSE